MTPPTWTSPANASVVVEVKTQENSRRGWEPLLSSMFRMIGFAAPPRELLVKVEPLPVKVQARSAESLANDMKAAWAEPANETIAATASAGMQVRVIRSSCRGGHTLSAAT